jgi:drug/metabolite transporter (DMT)-like permease
LIKASSVDFSRVERPVIGARSSRLLVLLALGGIYVVWGTTYFAIHVAIQTIPPLFLAACVFTLAGPLLVAIVAATGGLTSGMPPLRHWWSALLVGIGFVTFGNGVLSWAEQYVSTGVAALVVATVPIWLALFARVFLGERLRTPVIVGLGLGFGGLVILVAPANGGIVSLIGVGAVLLVAIGWSAASVYSKRAPLPANVFLAAGMQMFCGGLVTFGAALIIGDAQRFHLSHVSLSSILAYLYLTGVGAVFGIGIFQWLVRNAPLSLVGTYAYVNPIVAAILGVILLGEHLSPRILLAGAVIIVAVALVVAGQAFHSASADPHRRPRARFKGLS